MNFQALNEKIFDGDIDAAYATHLSINIEDSTIQFALQDLAGFSTLDKVVGLNNFRHVQTALSFEVVEFDGEQQFKGRKKRLGLFYLIKTECPLDIFLLSAGEFQAERFQVFLEGRIKN